jgi:hypothetical protein
LVFLLTCVVEFPIKNPFWDPSSFLVIRCASYICWFSSDVRVAAVNCNNSHTL